jgi:hypothetical protein
LPKNGAKRTGITSRLTRRRRTTCCTQNAYEDVPNACTDADIDELPDAAFIAFRGAAFVVRGDTLLHWTPDGYDARKPRPRRIAVDVLTPPAIIGVLSAGYEPRWHRSATD